MARNLGPSKNQVKHPNEIRQVCADCSANGAEWASINRGVLVCTDCCSVHRSLGRHVSEIKFIHDQDWHPHTWNLVSLLSSGGANGVWEHTLLDPTNSKNNKKKPLPSDPVHPVKADFVRAKHQMMSYVLHPPSPSPPHSVTCLPPALGEEEAREGGASAGPHGEEEDALSQELHSSVRTANLETSLRLLAQGADPNYFHKGRGNYPLHVAATSGQAEQVELLLVYGATPQCLDTALLSPAHAARNAGYSDIAVRLTDVDLELVSRLLCHLSDQHTKCGPHSQPYRSASAFSPDAGDSRTFCLPRHLTAAHQHATDAARQAREKLIKLPILLLEELAADLYDEVDRRELDQVWSRKRESLGGTGDRCDVPFLPVNPLLSSTRNQARQKLARLQEGELCSLIVDLLVEAERRMAILTPSRSGATAASARAAASAAGAAAQDDDDDEPVYDTVCEDDDYSLIDAQLAGIAPHADAPRPTDQPEGIESIGDEPAVAGVVVEPSTRELAVAESGSAKALLVSSSLASSQQQVVTSTSTSHGSQANLASSTQKVRVTSQEYERLAKLVDQCQLTIQQLQSENQFMKSQLNQLTSKLQQLKQENDTLRVFGSPSPPAAQSPSHAPPYQSLPPIPNGNSVFCNSSENYSSGRCFSSLPYHQYEPSSPHHYHHPNSQSRHIETSSHHAISSLSFPPPPSEYSTPPPSLPYSPGSSSHGPSNFPRTPFFNVPASANNANKEWSRGRPFSMYDSRDQSRSGNAHWRSSPRDAADNNNDWEAKASSPCSAPQRGASVAHQRSASFSENTTTRALCELPSQAEVSALSTSIASGIQELLVVVQSGKTEVQPEKYLACSEKIRAGVRGMAAAFKKSRDGDNVPRAIHGALVSLLQTTVELNNLCSTGVYSQHIVEKAYDVAKATKEIVAFFQ